MLLQRPIIFPELSGRLPFYTTYQTELYPPPVVISRHRPAWIQIHIGQLPWGIDPCAVQQAIYGLTGIIVTGMQPIITTGNFKYLGMYAMCQVPDVERLMMEVRGKILWDIGGYWHIHDHQVGWVREYLASTCLRGWPRKPMTVKISISKRAFSRQPVEFRGLPT